MKTQLRPYNRENDFERVYAFLDRTFISDGCYPNWSPQRWEYMHFHPNLNSKELHKIGIWEDNNQIIAVANYEDEIRDAYLSLDPNCPHLKSEMIDYAERHLYKMQDNKQGFLRIFANDFDTDLEDILSSRGYKKDSSVPEYKGIGLFEIPEHFPSIHLPTGFKLKSLAEENDLAKVDRCLWRGFNHPGEPSDNGIEDRKLMQSSPRYRKDLNIVVEAMDGSFVSYSGIWLLPNHQSAHIEPVATDPDYRRLGLGKAAVMECIRRCALLGAKRVIVESTQPFYLAMGFKKIFSRNPWVKHIIF